jgi:RNA polymerase sigma-70 factor (ECF subfamily)
MVYSTEYFNGIYVEYGALLHRYLIRLTGDPQDAADIVQETFLRLYKGQKPPQCIKAWLYRTAYCIFIDHWRYHKRKPVVPLENYEEAIRGAVMISPESAVVEAETVNELYLIINQLQKRDKTALMLRGRDGATYREIAAQMGCSELVVKSVIHRARQKIKKMRSEGQLTHILG